MLDNSRWSWLLEDNDDGKDRDEHFDPVECRSIEMWELDSGEFVEHVNSHSPDKVELWIRNSSRPEAAIGGLRLLIANSTDVCCRRISLNVEALKACIDVFHIPYEYLDKAISQEEGYFKYCKDVQKTCWIMRYSFFIVAISYSPDENFTTGLVVTGAGRRRNLDGNLLTSRAYICHPILAPTLFISEEVQTQSELLDGASGDVHSLEKNVGLRVGFQENEEFMRQSDEALRIGADVRASLSNIRARTTSLTLLLELLLKDIQYVDDKVGSMHTGPAKTARHHELERCKEGIRDRIESLISQTRCLLAQIDNLGERAALQTSALHTIFAQRDSRANIEMARDSARLASAAKRDSSSMKTIAILTTVFLPGTFVSALFSTPLVESDPSQFWMYWAITIPLTGLVMGLWAMWMYWINGKNRIKDEEAADAVGLDEGKQKGSKSEKND